MAEHIHNHAQTLLIDADDTLWDNNIYFERAISSFISFLNHSEYTREEVRAVLNEVERECIVTHGYGLNSFAQALIGTFERLSVEPLTPALSETIRGFADTIATHPIEIFDGIEDTLQYLSIHHRLVLVTKGNVKEQSGKVDRSGLKRYFSEVEIVPEKDPVAYRSLVSKHNLAPKYTWMVGNSPKSDINPALEAGLNAVFVPHHMTWILEQGEVLSDNVQGKLLVVERFSDLRQHF